MLTLLLLFWARWTAVVPIRSRGILCRPPLGGRSASRKRLAGQRRPVKRRSQSVECQRRAGGELQRLSGRDGPRFGPGKNRDAGTHRLTLAGRTWEGAHIFGTLVGSVGPRLETLRLADSQSRCLHRSHASFRVVRDSLATRLVVDANSAIHVQADEPAGQQVVGQLFQLLRLSLTFPPCLRRRFSPASQDPGTLDPCATGLQVDSRDRSRNPHPCKPFPTSA